MLSCHGANYKPLWHYGYDYNGLHGNVKAVNYNMTTEGQAHYEQFVKEFKGTGNFSYLKGLDKGLDHMGEMNLVFGQNLARNNFISIADDIKVKLSTEKFEILKKSIKNPRAFEESLDQGARSTFAELVAKAKAQAQKDNSLALKLDKVKAEKEIEQIAQFQATLEYVGEPKLLQKWNMSTIKPGLGFVYPGVDFSNLVQMIAP